MSPHGLISDEYGEPACRCGYKPHPPEVKTMAAAARLINVHAQEADPVSEFTTPEYGAYRDPARTCTQCGARVADTELHTEWHRDLWHALTRISENFDTLAHVNRRA